MLDQRIVRHKQVKLQGKLVLGGTILSEKHLLRRNEGKIVMSHEPRKNYKLYDELRANPDTWDERTRFESYVWA